MIKKTINSYHATLNFRGLKLLVREKRLWWLFSELGIHPLNGLQAGIYKVVNENPFEVTCSQKYSEI